MITLDGTLGITTPAETIATNLTFTGTGNRITGDFSNATIANRVMFQTSAANSGTTLSAITSGTGNYSEAIFYNGPDTTLPINEGKILSSSTEFSLRSVARNGATNLPMTFHTAGFERARIYTSGNVLVTNPAGLGYGTGSGGTVTQATNKATAVTLNKPTGQITMNNAAMLTNTTVVFTVTNSLCAFIDTVSMNHRNGESYNVWVVPGIGSFDVYLKNISVSTLSDAVVLNFSIIKGATA
jgi:hypothetical protein